MEDVDGYVAVLLWHRHRRADDPRALETLLAYNVQDAVNLETLLVHACNRRLAELADVPFAAGYRLPETAVPPNPFRVDVDTVARVLRDYPAPRAPADGGAPAGRVRVAPRAGPGARRASKGFFPPLLARRAPGNTPLLARRARGTGRGHFFSAGLDLYVSASSLRYSAIVGNPTSLRRRSTPASSSIGYGSILSPAPWNCVP